MTGSIYNVNPYLVGGFKPSEKYKLVGLIIANIWKNKTCSKAPTRISMAHVQNHSMTGYPPARTLCRERALVEKPGLPSDWQFLLRTYMKRWEHYDLTSKNGDLMGYIYYTIYILYNIYKLYNIYILYNNIYISYI